MEKARNTYLLDVASEAMKSQSEAFRELSERLRRLASASDDRTAARAQALRSRLDGFAAKVILVGQVKAGKTALANVLAGHPGLLPSDVNPWTSVVTNIAINSKAAQTGTDSSSSARFTFFNRDEWDTLMVGGGRLGELAARAGASDEAMRIREQIEEMRLKTEKRLGRHFEVLLGQSHDYGYVDTELMERYVSLGDGDETEDVGSKTGRFADITKSADLFLNVPQYPMPVHFCDTPGVNDSFLMREQITLRSLRGAELCVVVLSAHQALSTVDLALMRIIATMEKRQIILFVNRVDELRDPARQIPEIRDVIRDTLTTHKAANDVPILFGSAKWAEAALLGYQEAMPRDSADTLSAYLQNRPELKDMGGEQAVWQASGVPDLLGAVSERIGQGSAQHIYDKISRNARNLANEARAVVATDQSREADEGAIRADGTDIGQTIREVEDHYKTMLDNVCSALHQELLARMEKAQDGFVRRATASLIKHFERHGEQGTWRYDPAGLRVLQRSAYLGFSRAIGQKVGKVLTEAARNVESVYRVALGDQLPDFRIEAPEPPRIPPPVGLGRTIALDLQGNWWRRWWQRRRGFEASAGEYAQLIRAETQTILNELDSGQVQPVLQECAAIYAAFMQEHVETIGRLSAPAGDVAQDGPAPDAAKPQSAAVFDEILRDLNTRAA